MQGQAGLHWGNAGDIVAVSIPLRKFHVFQEIVSKARKQQLCLETIDVSLLLQEVLNHGSIPSIYSSKRNYQDKSMNSTLSNFMSHFDTVNKLC